MRIARWIVVVVAVALVSAYGAVPAQRVTKPGPGALSHDDEAKLIAAIGKLHRSELILATDLARRKLDKTTVTKVTALAAELTKLVDDQHQCDPGQCVDPMTGLCTSCEPKPIR
jgi:uncharacterized membrane protein